MKKLAGILSILCCVIFAAGMTINAAELTAVMNIYTYSDSIVLFMKNQGKEISEVYLGADRAERFMIEETGPVRTIVVLDNSLSIHEKYRDIIRSFLTDLVATGKDGDTFTIATFAEELTWLVQESSDYLEIKQQIDDIRFENQSSYLTNAMYTVTEHIETYEDVKYTRIIAIADGIDNEALGYTQEELERKIQDVKVPVYTIGCSSEGNEENLKKMFSLSRSSNGKNYLLDEVSGTQILQDITEDTDIVKLVITPQDKSCDGSRKAVRVSFGEDYCTAEITMPFQEVTGTVEEEMETVLETESEVLQGAETGSETQEVFSLWKVSGMLFVILGVLIIAAIVAAVLALRRKKAGNGHAGVDLSGIGHSSTTAFVEERKEAGTGNAGGVGRQTELLIDEGKENSGAGRTNILGANHAVKLILKDMDDPARTFEYPLRDKVLVGKDARRCQIVIDYNSYVSGIHCEVISKGGEIRVRDGGGDVVASTNGTFVNNRKVAPELPLPSGAELRLGEVRFRVTYR